jgi:tRNA-specific 2-thiouridylase
MINEYKNGHTPNPDIMCNQEVKFKLFLDAALEDGADMIATGHYARVVDSSWYMVNGKKEKETNAHHLPPTTYHLQMAVDKNKDQTYFLYRVTGEAMSKTLFPVGEFTKPQVRKMAAERGLTTAVKKDSQGICFIGQIGIRDFLSLYVDAKPGNVIDKKSGKVLGHHDGAIFYTFGQRHGMDLGGGMPYYVVGKDMNKNEVYVTTDLNDDTLWKKTIELTNLHWINNVPADGRYQIRVRHRAPLVDATLSFIDKDDIKIELDHPERAIAPGQSVVIYDGDICLGGGIII